MSNSGGLAEREGGKNAPRPARNNLSCSNCRKDKQSCKKSDNPAQCERCIQKQRICDGPRLATTVRVSKPSLIQLVTLLLGDCRLSDKVINNVVFRPPGTAGKTSHASPGTSSVTLNEILQPKFGILARQIEALASSSEILNGTWPGSMKWYYEKVAPRDFRPKQEEEALLTAIKENLVQLRKPADMRGRLNPPSHSLEVSPDDLCRAYQIIASEIQDVLEQIAAMVESEVPGSGIQFGRGFPPSHLACMAGDAEIALRFWESNPLATDILGRTMDILVTEQNRFDILRWMDNHPAAGKLSVNHKDVRRLTALEIATILGLPECLEHHLLHQEPVIDRSHDTRSWPSEALSLFELGLAACLDTNTNLLISKGYAIFDHISYFRAAIELRKPELVGKLRKPLFDQFATSTRELHELADHADREADRIQMESNQVWKFWHIDNNRGEWLKRLEELRRQKASLTDLANSLRQRLPTPSAARAAVNSMLFSMPFAAENSRRDSISSSQMVE